jgi:hypothetical protein
MIFTECNNSDHLKEFQEMRAEIYNLRSLRDERLREVLEMVVGFCVNARETWPDWNDHLDVGYLYSKTSPMLKALK